MASSTTIEDWQDVAGNYVLDATIRTTTAEGFPGRWKYSVHVEEIGGETVLRYDNAHERTKGHERHAADGVDEIEFSGLLDLYDRFTREAEEPTPVSWDWPRSP
ncbi:hypothetical protein BRC90_09245 [Halobacteriales archaeon QS_4_69_34]|nr:MAG: hypothetical protein BRC90_09245 [Halobacteriales archaeon QS_4_69_34]